MHLGLEDLSIPQARALGAGILGATTHSLAEARRAKAAGADYVSCGAITHSARAVDINFGLEPE